MIRDAFKLENKLPSYQLTKRKTDDVTKEDFQAAVLHAFPDADNAYWKMTRPSNNFVNVMQAHIRPLTDDQHKTWLNRLFFSPGDDSKEIKKILKKGATKHDNYDPLTACTRTDFSATLVI